VSVQRLFWCGKVSYETSWKRKEGTAVEVEKQHRDEQAKGSYAASVKSGGRVKQLKRVKWQNDVIVPVFFTFFVRKRLF
jgi:hypothetical protein